MKKRSYLKNKITACCLAVLPLVSVATAGLGADSTTPGKAAPQTSWSFAVFCDTRSSYLKAPLGAESPFYAEDGISPYFQNVARALSREKGIDLVLFPGDLIRGKKPSLTRDEMRSGLTKWKSYIQPVVDAGIPVYYVRGNHDQYAVTDPNKKDSGFAESLKIWDELVALPDDSVNPVTMDTNTDLPGETYSFMHNGSLFLAIDEYADGKKTYDAAFVTKQLAQPADHKFVMAHQPVWNFKVDELGPDSQQLADQMEAGKVDLFFAGHIHSYQRITKTGYAFQEIIAGTGGAPQDDRPTVAVGGEGYVADPGLTVERFAGGPDIDTRLGYVVVTVRPDGSLTSVFKVLDNPSNPNSTVSAFDGVDIATR